MFTKEEQRFIDENPEFVKILKSMSQKEISAFAEIVTIICDLTPEERTMFYERVDAELLKMGRSKCSAFSDKQ